MITRPSNIPAALAIELSAANFIDYSDAVAQVNLGIRRRYLSLADQFLTFEQTGVRLHRDLVRDINAQCDAAIARLAPTSSLTEI